MKRLLGYDPVTGVQTWYHSDGQDGKSFFIEEIQDVSQIIEENKAIQNHHAGGAMGMNQVFRDGVKKGWTHVARIPNTVITKWLYEKGVNVFDKNHLPAVKRLLNDPEWRHLRVGTGKL